MNYANLAKTAQRLMAAFGQSMTLTSITNGVYDPATSAVVNTSADVVAFGVILPYSNGIENAPDSLIQKGDSQILINIAAEPKPNDTITVAGVVHTVVNVKALEPSGVNVLYDIQVRK